MERQIPAGVRATAILFALCATYLAVAGLLMLFRPGLLPMSAGAPLLFGLELAGPYMFLLMAVAGGGVAWGLVRLNNITRHVAMLIACAGIVMLLPTISGATTAANWKALATAGAGIVIRVVVAWYLGRADVAEHFRPAS